MKKETENLLYNKQFYELNNQDCAYLKKVIYKYENTYDTHELLFLGPIMFLLAPLMVYGIRFVVTNPLMFSFFGFIGLTTGLGVFSVVKRDLASLKELGLTRKEWKTLKKSNRIEELQEILFKYQTTEKSKIKEMLEKSKVDLNETVDITKDCQFPNSNTQKKVKKKDNKEQEKEFEI